ncbi:MAG: branched-chain amino acid transaminase [Chloroflexota bacterium]|nr:branched-chain amino acid transaminase [Chloroflexota bacterium]
MTHYAYLDKQIIPLEDAKIGIMTHALHYGTGCFDGIRGNWNAEEKQMYLFRVREHYERLHRSCHIMNIGLPYTINELYNLTLQLVEMNQYEEDVYVRPLAYKSSHVVGVRIHNLEDGFLMFVTPFGPYLDIEKGARCCISSWRRVDDNMIPPRAKVTGLYVNSALAKTEANENGFDEAILLNQDGSVSEGSGENIFIVNQGKLVTPPSGDNILVGITRDTIIEIAKKELEMETIERSLDRSELYSADECFMTGTAAHVTPVVSIDRKDIGDGKMGKITRELQKLYFDIIRGKNKKYANWVVPAYHPAGKTAKSH